MKEVLRLSKEEEKKEKPVEFLECWDGREWREVANVNDPVILDNVFFRERIGEFDYFICWNDTDLYISEYKGYLNSGKY